MVMLKEGVSIRAVNERQVQHGAVLKCLLHAATNRMIVVLGFNDGYGDVRLVIKYVIGSFGLATGDQFAPYNDSPLREGDFLTNLGLEVPTALDNGWRDELRPDVLLRHLFFVHGGHPSTQKNLKTIR